MSKSTKIFIAALLTCSVGLAVAYVVYRYSYAVSFYEVTDMIREQQGASRRLCTSSEWPSMTH